MAENAHLVKDKGEYGYSQESMDALTKERDGLKAENVKLKEALLRHGNHDENCRSNEDGPDTCDCGLDEGFKLCQT